MMTQKSINDLAYKIIGCAIEVLKHVGPGLLEPIYKECLVEELKLNNLFVETELPIPITCKGKKLNHSLRLDILVTEVTQKGIFKDKTRITSFPRKRESTIFA